ncbi:hypothetical protein SAY86_004921 [Trapa natans]|uniref:Protein DETOXIFICATION n=1 Tax=Trapa natans TaxID=22666 RepID=A0AAN7MGE8_TRANT|nr:hypothetical protein SAY86_004921 [Trapa natans]
MAEEDMVPFSGRTPYATTEVLEELTGLMGMVLPITAMNLLVFIRQVVSVLFLGRLGSLELAGGALSIGFTNITGYSVLVGLASGLEPVCSQAYGSKNWDLLSLSLQRMVLILLITIVPIGILWVNLEPIMVFLGQDRAITATAATFCLYSLPDLLTNTLLQPLRVFLRSQRVTKPMMYCSLAAVALHVPLNYAAVVGLGLGVPGVALASVLTNMNMVGLITAYVYSSGRCELMSWNVGGIARVVSGLGPLLKMAVPSCAGICLEWWWYEIITVMAGYLPDPTTAVAATGVLIQTTSMMYTVPMALAGCVSARVGNELGAGNPHRAKLGAVVALACAFVIGAVNVMWTSLLKEPWANVFTGDRPVRALVVSVMPIMGLCELGNCPQTAGCGILRGTARPATGARINLWSFYFVGTPVAVLLAFVFEVGFRGLWLGLLSAQAACVVSVLYVVMWRTDWEVEALRARRLTAVEMSSCSVVGESEGNASDEEEMGDGEVEEETRGLIVDGNTHDHI